MHGNNYGLKAGKDLFFYFRWGRRCVFYESICVRLSVRMYYFCKIQFPFSNNWTPKLLASWYYWGILRLWAMSSLRKPLFTTCFITCFTDSTKKLFNLVPIFIHLTDDPYHIFKRLEQRKRAEEEKLTLEYIVDLYHRYEQLFDSSSFPFPFVTIHLGDYIVDYISFAYSSTTTTSFNSSSEQWSRKDQQIHLRYLLFIFLPFASSAKTISSGLFS